MDIESGGKGPTLYIGSHNLFEVGSHIMAKSIGILFYFILFYFILFYFILFYFIFGE